MIDQESLRAYRSRWQAVAEIEALEQQKMSIAERWRQLNALLRMAAALKLPSDRDDHPSDIVQQRWSRLTEIYLSNTEGPA